MNDNVVHLGLGFGVVNKHILRKSIQNHVRTNVNEMIQYLKMSNKGNLKMVVCFLKHENFMAFVSLSRNSYRSFPIRDNLVVFFVVLPQMFKQKRR